MPWKREFLGFERPALISAADYLLSRYRRGARADLRNSIVVVPGGRAGRRLLEILVDRCAAEDLLLTPPHIETVGQLPEQLYRPKRPFATELTQQLVWAQALRAAPAESIDRVVPRPPGRDEVLRWMDLGELVRRQHLELAADGLDFSHVAQWAAATDGAADATRWQQLHQLQVDYLRRLDALEVWDIQTARLVAVDKRECATDHDLFLVATADMNITLRRMLDQVASRVTSLVFAPESWSDRFDGEGCLVAERWSSAVLPVTEGHVQLVDGPNEQAGAVRQTLAGYEGRYAADEIVVGLADESLVPDVQRVLAEARVATRWGPGTPLEQSSPWQLLRAVASYVERHRFADLAALLRHTDVTLWLQRRGVPGTYLGELDDYYQDHLPYLLDASGSSVGTEGSVLVRASGEVERVLRSLRHRPQPLTSWAAPILQLLVDVYGDRDLDRTVDADHAVLAACGALRAALQEQEQVPASVMPVVSAGTALRWLLDAAGSETAPAHPDPAAVELLGWLELPLDDAPALVITTFNEGHVPSSVNSDIFLPNALRQQLGITDNQRRYARDAYALHCLIASRESVKLIVARRNRDGDPLAPSRLLFATDPVSAARRALAFFSDASAPGRPVGPGEAAGEKTGRLTVPRPRPLTAPLTQLNVTSFRDYRACPYRFYLRHVLRLEPIDDDAYEMDGRGFGNLAHDVLREFGRHRRRNSTDAEEIAALLSRELDRCAARRYGRHTLPAVLVQIEQLRLRLKALAPLQAERAAAGWTIAFTEISPPSERPAQLMVDGTPFLLRGRMDRIDVHVESGQHIIWDYKTSDSVLDPDKTHREHGEWVDWQLPLYRHLAAAAGIPGAVQVGYILLPKDTSRIAMVTADWDEASLASADQSACEIIRAIRQEIFWPPARVPPAFSDAYAAVCQEGVLGG